MKALLLCMLAMPRADVYAAESPWHGSAGAPAYAADTTLGGLLGQLGPRDAGLSSMLAQAGQSASAARATGDAEATGSGGQGQGLGGAIGGLLNAVGGALGGNQHITPVDFRTLQGLLPESLPGYRRSHAGGANKQGMGIKTASAEAEYHGAGNQVVHVSITDISGVSGVLDMSAALPKDTDAASDEGYEKDVTIAGRPMHEKFTKAGPQSSLQVIIARRFAVDVDGTGVSMDVVQGVMGHVDLDRLEALKSRGAQK